MSDQRSTATAEVVAALERWQAETSERRYPALAITEVLDRGGSDHTYLAVTFAHGSDWFGWDVKPIADLFLRWLMAKHPELGGPHLAFLKARPDLVRGVTTEPPDPEQVCAELRRHAMKFAVDWLDRIPATHTICIPDPEPDERDPDSVRVLERDAPTAELQLRADAIARVLASRYDEAHPERSWRIRWAASVASVSPPDPASSHRELPLKLSFFPVDSRGLAGTAIASERHAHVRDFARAWLDLIPFTHAIYIAEPEEEDLREPVTVRVIRDDVDAEHCLREDDVADAIARRYRERYPAEAASIAWFADYCK